MINILKRLKLDQLERRLRISNMKTIRKVLKKDLSHLPMICEVEETKSGVRLKISNDQLLDHLNKPKKK